MRAPPPACPVSSTSHRVRAPTRRSARRRTRTSSCTTEGRRRIPTTTTIIHRVQRRKNRRTSDVRSAPVAFFIGLLIAAGAFGQKFDTSNSGALHGDYFVREILITGQSLSGAIISASSAIGVATFNGAGSYTFTGSGGRNSTGSYGVGANGLLYIQSFVDSTQYAYGGLSGIGPTAFVASATEGTSGDILVAIPAGSSVSAASLNGNYTAGYINFPNAGVTQVREASFNFAANGAGALSGVAVSGTAL